MTSPLFKTAARLIVPLTLMFAAYIALRGHNRPGGGFIGGLMVSVALIVYGLAHGRDAMLRLMPYHPRVLVTLGLAIAYTTALVPLMLGRPLLTSLVIDQLYIGLGQSIHFASAVFFDVGVLLVVVGVTVGMIQRLSEEVEAYARHEAACDRSGIDPAAAPIPATGPDAAPLSAPETGTSSGEAR